MDMGGLDNLIANTAYLQARKLSDADSRELRRWRRSLALPEPQDCAELRRALAPSFDSLCEQQPIGRRLFHDFLASVPAYQEVSTFLEEVQVWELAEQGPTKDLALQGLLATCVPAAGHPHAFLSPGLVSRCQAAATEEERAAVVALAKGEAVGFLQDQPFRDFLASPFYDRFLQWKLFEMQPISEKYFTEFRVLGKGGFGEVSVSGYQTGGCTQVECFAFICLFAVCLFKLKGRYLELISGPCRRIPSSLLPALLRGSP